MLVYANKTKNCELKIAVSSQTFLKVLQEQMDIKKQKIIEAVQSYLSYPNNWDGYNGKIPSSITVDNVIQFMTNFPADLALPYPGLAGDGAISLFWEQENIFIDISFIGDDTYSYFARNAKGKEYFGDNVALYKDLPEELTIILKNL